MPSGQLQSESPFYQRLRDLAVALTQRTSSSAGFVAALEALATGANGLFGATRTCVWLHERRARELALAASSDAAPGALAARVPADDPQAHPARGLRLTRAEVISHATVPAVLVPLRGWRRALGTLVIEGPFANQDPGELLPAAHELGRHVSVVIENSQLLDEILEQRRLLEDTFNSLLDLVVVTDGALRIVQMNEAFVARVGVPRAELFERPLDRFVGPGVAALISVDNLRDRSPTTSRAERTCRIDDPRLGGAFDVRVTPLLRRSGERAGHVIVARDITHQIQLETEREALRERLAQSEKLAALGQFVAGIAHEMNNPLQGVLGYLELMMETSEAARPLRRELRRIYQEADRAARIVRNLLAFTGSRRMKRRRLRLHRVLSRAIASRASALQRGGIQIVREDPPDLPMVMGDPLLLHQAFLNVLVNAEHAILSRSAGGAIAIRSATDASGTRVLTTIHDSGPGIPPNVLSRIFDPFFTTKEVGKGTGLGLAITYGIVQDHGGSIHAGNAPGGGATFTIELPAAQPAGADPAR